MFKFVLFVSPLLAFSFILDILAVYDFSWHFHSWLYNPILKRQNWPQPEQEYTAKHGLDGWLSLSCHLVIRRICLVLILRIESQMQQLKSVERTLCHSNLRAVKPTWRMTVISYMRIGVNSGARGHFW